MYPWFFIWAPQYHIAWDFHPDSSNESFLKSELVTRAKHLFKAAEKSGVPPDQVALLKDQVMEVIMAHL
jgi:hypothetical protein